ncbi:hypothetical protein [Sphingobacterium cellulitidis]|nr:hypothetical protein [Sphingobacterium cellulitidis]
MQGSLERPFFQTVHFFIQIQYENGGVTIGRENMNKTAQGS